MRARLLPLLTIAALLAGCTHPGPVATNSPSPSDNGVAALSAAEIVTRATQAIKRVPTYAIEGRTAMDGGKRWAIDLRFKGRDMEGSITTDGVRITLIQLDGVTYVKAPDALWARVLPYAPAVRREFKGMYLKFTPDNPVFAETVQSARADALLKTQGPPIKLEATTVGGRAAVKVIVSTSAILFVATTGEPLPLRLSYDGDDLNFSYGFDTTITAPPADQVVDLNALKQK